MNLTIRPCPKCSSLLLDDSAACPHCGHILDAARSSEMLQLIPSEEVAAGAAPPASETEEPCPHCGEMVRIGLVRCWGCGQFIHSEMAEAYRGMQASPAPMTLSRLPENTPDSARTESVGQTAQDSSSEDLLAAFQVVGEHTNMADDTGFELDPSVEMTDDDFELDPIPDLDHDEFAVTPLAAPIRPPSTSFSAAEGEHTGDSMSDVSVVSELPSDPDLGPPLDVAPLANEPSAEETAAEGTDESPQPPVPDVAHSVSTGGDVLLAAAMAEEQESAKAGKKRKKTSSEFDGITIFCPNGHRVRVQGKHRGRMGRCPNCKSLFVVPEMTAPAEPVEAQAEAAAPTEPVKSPDAAGKYHTWLFDLRLHPVQMAKLKPKAGVLANDYETADLGFSDADLLLASVFQGGGMLRSMQEPKKKAAARAAIKQHLEADKSLDTLPAPRFFVLTATEAGQLKIAQPPDPQGESLFGGVAVFGPGRIAVRLPGAIAAGERLFISFTLSEFRQFAQQMQRLFGIENYGASAGVPLVDAFTAVKCHYTDSEMSVVEAAEFYQADPKFKLEIAGRKCAGCGLIVSEDGRKKEKLGGASGSTLPKTPCPKCKRPFGTNTLYRLVSTPTPAAPTPEPAAT